MMRWRASGRQPRGLVDMADSLLDCLRDEVALRLEGGARLADVQDELIDSAQGLSEDERAALWLFAWAYRSTNQGQSRRVVESML
jgi:hypothetical protein